MSRTLLLVIVEVFHKKITERSQDISITSVGLHQTGSSRGVRSPLQHHPQIAKE